jgi:hypothetical protein
MSNLGPFLQYVLPSSGVKRLWATFSMSKDAHGKQLSACLGLSLLALPRAILVRLLLSSGLFKKKHFELEHFGACQKKGLENSERMKLNLAF